MRNSKLYVVLNSLSGKQKKSLVKFVQSPYFNENQSLIKLFNLLISDLVPEKDEIWKQIRPGSPFNDTLFRRMCSDLTKLIYDFIAIDGYKQSPVLKKNDLLKTFQ